MVMEAPPSPQSVGREFVRQYYTLLNKAPTHLHRFYNHQSSFVHGGLDPPNRETLPVIGQKQIHQKIQQLGFRDCHAKITQVDSQATLGDGVVVQVTGELSNAGQPMRRFTQTFVLASQSPKKYYVHNDVFRYQDEIISDEECEGENRCGDAGDDVAQDLVVNQGLAEQVQQQITQLQQQPPAPMQYYNAAIQPTMPQVQPHHQQQPPHVLTPQAPVVTTVNGSVHPDELGTLPVGIVPSPVPGVPHAAAVQNQVLQQVPSIVGLQPSLVQGSMNSAVPFEESAQVIEAPVEEPRDIGTDNDAAESEPQDVNVEPVVVSNEPKTYANLLKSGNSVPYTSAPLSSSIISLVPRSSSPPSTANRSNDQGLGSRNSSSNNNNSNNNSLNRGGPRPSQGQRIQKQDSTRGMPGRNSFNDDGFITTEERKPRSSQNNNYSSDSNQLFLGNLPHNATEDELRDIFSEYGNIIELRIHAKSNSKVSPGMRNPPNYGFITYDNSSGVQNCLAAKPIFYPKDDKNGIQLNVEEKKTKERQSYGGRPNDSRPPRGGGEGNSGGPRRSGPGGGPNRNNGGGGASMTGGGSGPTPNRSNSYSSNRTGGGGGGQQSSRGSNTYTTTRR